MSILFSNFAVEKEITFSPPETRQSAHNEEYKNNLRLSQIIRPRQRRAVTTTNRMGKRVQVVFL